MWTPNVEVAIETDLLYPRCLECRRCSIKSAAPVIHLVIYQASEPLLSTQPRRFLSSEDSQTFDLCPWSHCTL